MLLILDSTTKTLAARGSASAAINYTVAYADSTATSFSEASVEGVLQSSTNVTILAAPSAGVKRVVKSINLYNNNGTPQGAIIAYQNSTGSLSYDIANILMGANERWSSSDRVIPPAQLIVGTTPVYNGNANEALSISSGGLLTQVGSTGTGIFVKATNPFVSGLTINSGGLTITNSPQSIVTDPGTFTVAAAATTVNVGSTANTNGINLAVGTNGTVTVGGGAPSGGAPILRLTGPNGTTTGLRAASGAGVTFTLPSADGTNNQVLATNGSGTLSWVTQTGTGGGGGPLALKNVLHNGEFRVAQRGDGPFTSATTFKNDDAAYQLDRWYLLSDGNAVVDVSKTTDAPTGRQNSIGLQVKTTNKKFGIAQIVEYAYGIHLTGMATSLSFKMRVSNATNLTNVKAAIFSWTGTTDTVTTDIVSAWNSGGTTPSWVANLTLENTITSFTPTTSWATYKVENVNIDTSGMKNIVVFIWSDVTTTTADHFLYLTDIQLEMSATATDFECVPFDIEQQRCERYLLTNAWKVAATSDNPRMFGGFTNLSTTSLGGLSYYTVVCYVDARVNLRKAVTGLVAVGAASTWNVFENASQTLWDVGSITFTVAGNNSGAIDVLARRSTNAPTTLGGFCTFFPNGSTGTGNRLVFTGAEL